MISLLRFMAALSGAAVFVFFIVGCSASVGVSVNGDSNAAVANVVDSGDDVDAIRAKLDAWRAMFSATGRGQRFDIDDYPELFLPQDQQNTMLTFDAYVPAWASTQIDGVDGYRTVWNKDVNETFPGWTIEKMDVLRVEISGNLAWSALNFWGTGVREDGSTYEGSQHGTHVWYDVGDGDWRIAHEHLTQIVVMGEPNVRYDNSPPAPRPESAAQKDVDSADAAATADVEAVKALAKEWIEIGFSPKSATQTYSFEKDLQRFYAEGDDLSLHDNNDPQMRIETNARRYSAIWEELFGRVAFVDNELTGFYQTLVQGDLALVSFTADAIVKPTADDEALRTPVFYSIGMKHTTDGWKIVHEHGSTLTKAPAVQPK